MEFDFDWIAELKKEADSLQRVVQAMTKSKVAWMHPVCNVLGLSRPGEAHDWGFDDEALLDFGGRVLKDLRRGVYRRSDIRTPWGDTYGSIPIEVSIERVKGVLEALRTSLAFWSQTRRQVKYWWRRLDEKIRVYLQDFSSTTVEFDQSKLEWHMQFLHSLFTSSRAVLLLCMARVTFLLYVAPWGETAPEDYSTLRLRAFWAMRAACEIWHLLVQEVWSVAYWVNSACIALDRLRDAGKSWHLLARKPWSVAYWVKSACIALDRQEFSLVEDRGPDDGLSYDYPRDMIDADEQADSEDADFRNSEFFPKKSKRGVWEFFKAQPAQWELFSDCYSMDYWYRAHSAMCCQMEWYKSINGGKPLHISVIQDEAAVEVSENDARSCAVQLWPYFIEAGKGFEGLWYREETIQSLDRMVRASKEGAIDAWWPEEMSIHKGQKQHVGFRIKAHSEAILCQDWVKRRVRYCCSHDIADA